jgi:hypothetical protein
MKKLLALILCVAMVLSIAPAAFAAFPGDPGTVGGDGHAYPGDRVPEYMGTAAAKKAVTDLGKDIKAMYYAIAADEAVFGTAKGIYDFTDSLAKDLLKDIDKVDFANGDTIYQEDLISNVRKGFNHIIGNEISNYLNDRVSNFTDGNGNIQPDKYLNTFVKAVNNALTSNKAQKNIQAMIYGLAALKTQVDVNDRADDLYDDIVEWDHWKEFYWTHAWDAENEEWVAAQVEDPDPDAGNGGYAFTWLPTWGVTNTVLVPTGSTATAFDAATANAMLHGDLDNFFYNDVD